jgi:hypothetical protein
VEYLAVFIYKGDIKINRRLVSGSRGFSNIYEFPANSDGKAVEIVQEEIRKIKELNPNVNVNLERIIKISKVIYP